jgi:sec-independent protein translocase protein TatA
MLSSPIEVAMVFGVALLLFGPKKLPELGQSVGKAIGNFKRSMHDASEEISTAVKVDPVKPAISADVPQPAPTLAQTAATPAPPAPEVKTE